MHKATQNYLEDQIDLKNAEAALEEFHKNNSKTYTLEKIMKSNELLNCIYLIL